MIKPILFNTEMVQAILAGRKTVTRRIMRPQPLFYTGRKYIFADGECPSKWEQCDNIIETYQYQPGDILYVRETWGWEPCWDCGMDMEEGGCAEESATRVYNQKKREYGCYCYKASMEDGEELSVDTWHPSIHMPKDAARIWLKVGNVRVERLQDITEEQAVKEGAIDNRGFIHSPDNECTNIHTAREHFIEIWNSTIKKADQDLYSWDANPWVWVIEFERCEKPEGWCV